MRCYLFDETGNMVEEGDSSLIKRWKSDDRLQIWCDDTAPDVSEENEILQTQFGVPETMIYEAQKQRHPAKFEKNDPLYFMILKGLDSETEDMDFNTIQIAFIRGYNFLFTRHNGESMSTDKVWSHIHDQENTDLDRVVIDIAANVNKRYLRILFELERRLEEIEEEILDSSNDSMLEELAHYRTDLKRMRRFLDYHVQVFEQIEELQPEDFSREDMGMVSKTAQGIQRAHSLSSLYDEQIADLMDSSLSLSSHRLNQVMKVLTIITVIFVPLSFLAGIYGMNFENIPELHSQNGYFILLGVMLTIVATTLYVFKRIRWL